MPSALRPFPFVVFLLCATACGGGSVSSPDAGFGPECRLSIECPLGHDCRAGRCVPGCSSDRDCAAGETCDLGALRCIRLTVPDAGTEEDAGAEDGGTTCEASCVLGARSCSANVLTGCVQADGGCPELVVLDVCEQCVDGECVEPPCVAGTRRCGGAGVEICNELGLFDFETTCVQGCVDGACATTVACAPGSLRCLDVDGEIEQRCSTRGDAWLFTRRCALGCVDGRCADPAEEPRTMESLSVVGEDLRLSGEVVVSGDVELTAGARMLVDGALTLRARSIHLDATSSIIVAATGVGPEGNAQDGKECASSTSIASGGGGGGSGAKGEDSSSVNGGCFPKALGGAGFGTDRDTSVAPGGRGGTGGGASGGAAGRGGGVLRLVAQNVVIEGDLLVDAEHGRDGLRDSGGGGGGAGGGIVLQADSVMVTPGARVSAAGGIGGTGSWLGNGVGGGAYGGDGALGRVKVLANERDLAGDLVGVRTESAPAPLALSSSTHPEEAATWNDGAPFIDLAWETPFGAESRDVLWVLSRSSSSWPTVSTGQRARPPVLQLPMPTTAGDWFVFVTSLDANGQAARASARRRFVVNTTPPTVTSASHRAGSFTDESTAVFAWTDPSEGRHWPRYRWEIDRKGRTMPTVHETAARGAIVEGLEPGRWVFHVVALDRAGAPTKVARHFEFGVGPSPGTGTLEVTVRNATTGQAIASAAGTLNEGLEDATASSAGLVRFSNVFAGNYELVVTRSGYASRTLPVRVVAGVTTRLDDVLLTPSP